MEDNYVFGALLLPFLTALYVVFALRRGRRRAPTIYTALVPAFLTTEIGVGGAALWVALGLGMFLGFILAETERLSAERSS
ncbi:MAG: hypothetical protein AAF899_02360 [Pseudomonadota bacterium]